MRVIQTERRTDGLVLYLLISEMRGVMFVRVYLLCSGCEVFGVWGGVFGSG